MEATNEVKPIFEGVSRCDGETQPEYRSRQKKEKVNLKNHSKNKFLHLSKYIHKESEQETEKRIIEETLEINRIFESGKIDSDKQKELISKVIKTSKTYKQGSGTKVGKVRRKDDQN